MNPIRKASPLPLVGLALAAVLAVAGALPAQAQQFNHLEGFLVDNAGLIPGFSSGTLDVRIDAVTSDTELARLARLTKKEGKHALLNELADQDLGSLRISQSLGRPLAIVQETREEGLRKVLVVLLRDVSVRERFSGALTVDYPYVVIDATVGRDGKGEGEFYPLARLRISPDGKLTYQSLAGVPMRILQLEAS
jgi:hypothetical protein